MRWRGPLTATLAGSLCVLAGACGGDDDGSSEDPSWRVVHEELDGALLSVWGESADDVWTVGGDAGDGPMVMHWDGSAWETFDTGTDGDLWWVFGTGAGSVYMGGAGGTILRYQGGDFTPMTTPGTETVYGIWGCDEDDLWAVGAAAANAGAFAWRLDPETDTWVDQTLPDGVEDGAVWKVYGRSCNDVWFVGTGGHALHWDGEELTLEEQGADSMFTVSGNDDYFAAVGGSGTGIILENEGSGWTDASPAGANGLFGIDIEGEVGWASGQYGRIFTRAEGGWVEDETAIGLVTNETLHAIWIDPSGGVWSVGGLVISTPLVDGVMLYRGDAFPGGDQ